MILELIFCLPAVLLLLPDGIVFVEIVAGLLLRPEAAPPVPEVAPRTVVLVPATNEEIQIEATVRSLLAELGARDRLIVIADNCDDHTAAIAQDAGAAVIERHDPKRRGKGFAIAFGVDHLTADPPDVVVVVDADCQMSRGGVTYLSRQAMRLNRPIQAEYVFRPGPPPTPVTIISALALVIRSRVRQRGLRRLGLPCQLAGSGMAFPWKILREAPSTGADLVEDLVMGLRMALAGHPPRFCPEVQVTSELPYKKEAAMGQRRRWEHGHLHTLLRYFPRLVAAGLFRRRIGLLGLGLDLMVPPLALLVMLQGTVLAVTAVAGALGLVSFLPALLAVGGLAILTAAIGMGWLAFGRQVAPLRYALSIPKYLLWKLPLYVSLALRGRQKTWVRTARGETNGATNRVPVPSPGLSAVTKTGAPAPQKRPPLVRL